VPGSAAAERGRQARERLLRVAAELIAERGWTAVSTRMVAERAGVAPGVVHYHFATLPALLRQAALGAMSAVVDQLGPVLAGASSAEEALEVLLGALDAYDGTDPVSLLFVEAYLAATRDDELRAALAGLIQAFRDQLADRLVERHVADPAATAAVLTAAIDGVMLHRAFAADLTAARVGPVLRRLITSGGAATPTRKAGTTP
jgi:AcrR family transcriptional regulator